jgi:DNA-directed RNA polymerase specialized sigma24 family protein
VHFRRDVLIPRKWDYRRGATLRTFFVGQCLIRFANVYRRWYGNEKRNQYDLTDDNEALDIFTPRMPSPDDRAIDGAVALEVIATIKDPRVKRAMLLTAGGQSQAEIAIDLEVSEKTVERMLANERARIRRRQTG